MKPMRYAHSDGHTDVCYDDEGRYILTCGTDGDVRVWAGIEDDDAVSHRVGDRAYAIAFKKDRFFTATDTNSVQASKFPDGMPDGLVTRFTAPIHHMVFNATGSTMVAGSSDFTVKVVDVESSSQKVYRGHKAPVLSVALDPKEQFTASSSCDGTVHIWSTEDLSLVKEIPVSDKCSDVSLSKSLCRLCWSSDGETLLVPVGTEVHKYARNTWELQDKMLFPEIVAVVNVLGLSSDGQHLAAGCVDGVIAIIDWRKCKIVDKRRHEKGLTITALAWNPTNKHHIAFCDREGQLGLLEDVLVSQTNETASSNTVPNMAGVFDDDDDMLMQASCQAEGGGTHDGLDDYDDDADSIDLGAIKKKLMPAILGEEDSNAADSVTGSVQDGTDGPGVTARLPPPVIVEGFKPTPLQKAFQPGSTPLHLTSRFMKWNSVGIVRQYNSEEESSIDVEFHDTATHHAMHITNTCDFTMADLTAQAVVLANVGDEEGNSKLTCMHFGSWDSAKEWTISMPEGEVIEAVAAGDGFVAAATSNGNVRLFTVGGVQRWTFTLPGPVVCLVAHAQQLMAVYHAGMGIPGNQNLACRTLNVKGQKRQAPETLLPLSPKSTLSWAGFSAEGTPFIMDSDGMIRMLNAGLASVWTEVSNTRRQVKGKSDHYWIVGINEYPQQLRCIPCKGSRYPATLPRPAVTVLPFELPLCEGETEKSQYEEQYMRSMLFSQGLLAGGHDLDETEIRNLQRPTLEALMKLFALSVRSEREFRAMEVCGLMPDDQTLQLSIKYASRQHRLQLAQRISQLAQQRALEEQEERREEEEEEDFREYLQASHNTSETEWAPKSNSTARQEEEDMEEEGEGQEEEDKTPSGPMLNVKPKDKLLKRSSSGRANPFKVASQKESGSTKGSQVFDEMKKTKDKTPIISPLPISVKQSKGGQRKITVSGKKSQQAKIAFSGKAGVSLDSEQAVTPDASKDEQSENQPSKKPASAFELWLSEHEEELQEEHPELSEEERNRTAAEQFRALSKEDRQVWLLKARALKQKADCDSDKKRKRSEEDPQNDVPSKKNASDAPAKKPLAQSANSKLAGFAFSAN